MYKINSILAAALLGGIFCLLPSISSAADKSMGIMVRIEGRLMTAGKSMETMVHIKEGLTTMVRSMTVMDHIKDTLIISSRNTQHIEWV